MFSKPELTDYRFLRVTHYQSDSPTSRHVNS